MNDKNINVFIDPQNTFTEGNDLMINENDKNFIKKLKLDQYKPHNPRDYQAPGGGVYLTNVSTRTPKDRDRIELLRTLFAERGIDAEIFDTPVPGYDYSQGRGHTYSMIHENFDGSHYYTYHYKEWKPTDVPYGYTQALADGYHSVVSYEDDHEKVWSILMETI